MKFSTGILVTVIALAWACLIAVAGYGQGARSRDSLKGPTCGTEEGTPTHMTCVDYRGRLKHFVVDATGDHRLLPYTSPTIVLEDGPQPWNGVQR